MNADTSGGHSSSVPIKNRSFIKYIVGQFLLLSLVVLLFFVSKKYAGPTHLVFSPILFLGFLFLVYVFYGSFLALIKGRAFRIRRGLLLDYGSLVRLGPIAIKDLKAVGLKRIGKIKFLTIEVDPKAKVLKGWDEPKGLYVDFYCFITKGVLFFPRVFIHLTDSKLNLFIESLNTLIGQEKHSEVKKKSRTQAHFVKEPPKKKQAVSSQFKFSLKKTSEELRNIKEHNERKKKAKPRYDSMIEIFTKTEIPKGMIQSESAEETAINSGQEGELTEMDQEILDLYAKIIRPLFKKSPEEIDREFHGLVSNLQRQEGELSSELLGVTISGREYIFKMVANESGDLANLMIYENHLLVYKLLLRFDLTSLEALKVLAKTEGDWSVHLFSLRGGSVA